MLEKSEHNRYNFANIGGDFIETNTAEYLNKLSAITSTSTLVEDKTVITETLTDLLVKPAQDTSSHVTYNVTYDWAFELLRMLVYSLH